MVGEAASTGSGGLASSSNRYPEIHRRFVVAGESGEEEEEAEGGRWTGEGESAPSCSAPLDVLVLPDVTGLDLNDACSDPGLDLIGGCSTCRGLSLLISFFAA